ncbi:MAG: hypothetical protein II930_05045 [Lachnospiraceae bacterium]|nr:hypothetical protein [Lachnospiraceae bacterium]
MKNVLIYGDSNTWGYDVTRYVPEADIFQRMTETERWPGIVRSLLGPEYNIIEDALNARTVAWDDPYNPGRNGWKGLKTSLDVNAPLDLVVIQLGCNELKEFFNLSAGMIAFGVEKLVKECATSYWGYPAPKVLLIAPAPTHPDIGILRSGVRFGPNAYKKSLSSANTTARSQSGRAAGSSTAPSLILRSTRWTACIIRRQITRSLHLW